MEEKMEESYERLKKEQLETLKYFGEAGINVLGDTQLEATMDEIMNVVWMTVEVLEAAKKENDDLLRAKRRQNGVERIRRGLRNSLQKKREGNEAEVEGSTAGEIKEQLDEEVKAEDRGVGLLRRTDTLTRVTDVMESGEVFTRKLPPRVKLIGREKAESRKEKKFVAVVMHEKEGNEVLVKTKRKEVKVRDSGSILEKIRRKKKHHKKEKGTKKSEPKRRIVVK